MFIYLLITKYNLEYKEYAKFSENEGVKLFIERYPENLMGQSKKLCLLGWIYWELAGSSPKIWTKCIR